MNLLVMGNDPLGYFLVAMLKNFTESVEVEAWIITDTALTKKLYQQGYAVIINSKKYDTEFDGSISSIFEIAGEEFDTLLVTDFSKRVIERLSRVSELEIKAKHIIIASKVLYPILAINKSLLKKIVPYYLVFDGFLCWTDSAIRVFSGETIYIQKELQETTFYKALDEALQKTRIQLKVPSNFRSVYWLLTINHAVLGMLFTLGISPKIAVESKSAREIYVELLADWERLLRLEGIRLPELRTFSFRFIPKIKSIDERSLEYEKTRILEEVEFLYHLVQEKTKVRNITLTSLPLMLRLIMAIKESSRLRRLKNY
ncbi:MAG: hypothetical protein ACTSX9_04605 [Candidatus Njordarchaeales archaeon]